MSKIQLELGGKYSAGEMFKRADDDVKAFGRTNKDAIKAGTDCLRELEKGFGEDLTKAVNTTKGVIQGLAQGGLWGAIGAVAGAAISLIVQKFKEAEEAAKKVTDYLSGKMITAIKGVNAEYANTKKEIEEVQKAAEDAVGVLSSKAAADLSNKVYEIHTQSLQKMTDDMTERGRAVLSAQEKLEVALATSAITWSDNNNKVQVSQERLAASQEKVEVAQNAIAETLKIKETLENQNALIVSRRNGIQERIEQLEQQHISGEITNSMYREKMGKILMAKAQFEEENKTVLERLTQAENEYNTAIKNADNAESEKIQASNALKIAQYKAAESETQHKAAIDAANEGLRRAQEALEKETRAKSDAAARQLELDEARAAAEELYQKLMIEDINISESCIKLKLDEAYWIQKYNQLRRFGLSEEEAITQLNRDYKEYKKQETFITKVCTKLKLDEKEYMKAYLQCIEEGKTSAEAYAELQEKVNKALKERADAEEKATEATKNDPTNSNADDKKNPNNLVVRMSANGMGDLGEAVENKLSFKDWQKQHRDEQRKVRDARNNMKIDQAKMTKALKGEMPQEEAKQWMEYAKRKYTPDQMKELGKLAMNKELLSKKEQQKQVKAVCQMAKEIAKSLTIK